MDLGSLPEFMNFNLFGKTLLVVNIEFGLFLGQPLSKGEGVLLRFPLFGRSQACSGLEQMQVETFFGVLWIVQPTW